MSDEKGVIEFGGRELDPSQEQAYRDRVRQANTGLNALKGSEPVGSVPRPKIPLIQNRSRQSAEDPMEAFEGPQGQGQGVQSRGPGAPVLRGETARQLEAAAQAQAQQEKEPEPPKAVSLGEDDEESVFDAFDFSGKDEAQKILDNKKRKRLIESRCSKMDFRDLLEKDEVRQVVPIRPDDFVVEYRSMTPAESLFIKQIMSKEENRTELYVVEKYGLCQLACGLVAINGTYYAPHFTKDGDVDEEVFTSKLKKLTKKSGYIIADLALNYHWFDLRVRRLINVDEVGNG